MAAKERRFDSLRLPFDRLRALSKRSVPKRLKAQSLSRGKGHKRVDDLSGDGGWRSIGWMGEG